MFVIDINKNSRPIRTIWTPPYKCPLLAIASVDQMRSMWSGWTYNVRKVTESEITAGQRDCQAFDIKPGKRKWK
jgi:hypothetical protein